MQLEVRRLPHDIEIHESADLKGATVVVGFPGVGFSSPIATNYLIKQQEMTRVGHVVSGDFPPVASIHEYEPQHPMRIYQKDTLVAVTMEFVPQGDVIRPLGMHLLKWASEGGAERIIVFDTMSPSDLQTFMDNRAIYSVGATHSDRVALDKAEMELIEEGMITGLSGVMLAEGASSGVPVIGILTEAHPMFPDVRAAIMLLEEAAKVAPQVQVDLAELEESATEVESTVKDQVAQASQLMEARMGADGEPVGPAPVPAPSQMYG
ncbi:MAG: proteasome assembly chaperone family protein [Thermoplasmata archaeon]|nr:proteasome assembly chaperone family protein [Thermoplasmata archaeon]